MSRVFDISALPPEERLAAWRKNSSELIHTMDVRVTAPPTRARFVSGDDLGIRTTRVIGAGSVAERSHRLIDGADDEDLLLTLTLDGSFDIEQGESGGTSRAGDLAWYSSARPYRVEAPGPVDLLHVILPGRVAPMLRDVLGGPGAPLPRDAASTLLVTSLLRGIGAAQPVSAAGPPGGDLEGALLGVLGALPRGKGTSDRGGDEREALFDAAVRYVHDHLGEADLDPARIAAAVPVSVRYLHLLFAEREMSVAGYVREERLLGAARDLADPAHAHRKVGEIGRARGFVSAAHFNRSFARRFGRTPGRYRASGERDLRLVG
ncbi:helix-turn-helix domain-containing protein [Pseudonocardia nematodicida]|uniref:Helix-turn-helix domain-containing protein n=1 Tax=Pseudonocardia nematodicida TaxID=1206997 RepID=A0ABV1KJM5_9PSEU